MRRGSIRITAPLLAVLALAGLLGSAAPAGAHCGRGSGEMCAWDGGNYDGDLLFHANYAAGSRNIYPERRDAISSGKNWDAQEDRYCGVDEHTFLPDETIVIWNYGDNRKLGGTAVNNRIDHFDVVAKGRACPA